MTWKWFYRVQVFRRVNLLEKSIVKCQIYHTMKFFKQNFDSKIRPRNLFCITNYELLYVVTVIYKISMFPIKVWIVCTEVNTEVNEKKTLVKNIHRKESIESMVKYFQESSKRPISSWWVFHYKFIQFAKFHVLVMYYSYWSYCPKFRC
jgi:hypothetical protein